MNATTQQLIVSPTDSRARIRLVCLPYAGGGTSAYWPWAQTLPTGFELVPVRLPGREDWVSEPAYTCLDDLVDALSGAIDPIVSKPFALFGHSMGALLAFELTRALRRKRMPMPVHLFVSGCRAPHLTPVCRIPYNLPRSEFVAALVRLNKGLAIAAADAPLLDLLLPTIRADLELCQTYRYRPEPPLSCPLTALGGRDDEDVALDDVRAWRLHTVGAFRTADFPGDHFFLNSARRLVTAEIVGRLVHLHGAH